MRRTRALPRDVAALAAAFLLCSAQAASAACASAVAPDPASRPAKPTPPVRSACVDNSTGPGCLGWESYRYNDDVKAFNEKAQAFQKAANEYVAKLNAYVKAANDYAKCEVDTLR